jgi:hypothetical protein
MGYYYKFRTRAAEAASDSGGNVVALRPAEPGQESTTEEIAA